MNVDSRQVDKALRSALSGTGAHVGIGGVFAGLNWKTSGLRPGNAPHSIYEVLNHMTYWQEWVIAWLDLRRPRSPRHASGSWPGPVCPANSREWQEAVRRFRRGLQALTTHARRIDVSPPAAADKSRLEMLHTIASHNSYHAGQVALLRQMLGAWPPPSGGLTW